LTGEKMRTSDREIEYGRIMDSFFDLKIPKRIQNEIMEALTDPAWDWFTMSDGCTCVSEFGWPTKYFPPCVAHDYYCQTKRGGFANNARFYRHNRAYKMSRARAILRTVGTDLGWIFWFRWQ